MEKMSKYQPGHSCSKSRNINDIYDCTDAVSDITDLLESDLCEEEQQRLAEHIAQCSICHSVLTGALGEARPCTPDILEMILAYARRKPEGSAKFIDMTTPMHDRSLIAPFRPVPSLGTVEDG
ncbi:MAG: zf-HC2 domain-containing protein [Proteobacteria bacterium]|nr:zf-HC2 domain-containing protein [Pseudomonadota bacterium]